jgi:hypothetical protein
VSGAITDRHLVLDSKADAAAGQALIAVACKGDEFVPYDRAQHTYLTRLSTCTECRVVHAAWVELFKADLDRRSA